MTIDLDISVVKEDRCPECNNNVRIISDYSTGDIICGECGLVIREKMIDQGPDWRAFDVVEVEKRVRTGTPTNVALYDKGLATIIPKEDRDIYGNKIKGNKRYTVGRIRKMDNRIKVHSARSKNLSKAMAELELITSQLELQKDIKMKSAYIYRKALEKGMKYKTIFALIGSSIYLACRIKGYPISFITISEIARVKRRTLQKFYNQLVELLNEKVPAHDPKVDIPKLCSDLNLSHNVELKAYKILDKLKSKANYIGKAPSKIAGSVIYIASILEGEKVTQRGMSRLINMSEVTIRNRAKEIAKKLGITLK